MPLRVEIRSERHALDPSLRTGEEKSGRKRPKEYEAITPFGIRRTDHNLRIEQGTTARADDAVGFEGIQKCSRVVCLEHRRLAALNRVLGAADG